MLFIGVSLSAHAIALLIFGATYQFEPMSAENMNTEDAMSVETVNLPPSPPTEAVISEPPPQEQSPPEPEAPPTPKPQAPPSPQEPAPPVSTPKPAAKTPAPSATPAVQTSASPVPSPSVTPSPTPTPDASASPQYTERDQFARAQLTDFLKSQDIFIPDELPPGIESWEELAKQMTDETWVKNFEAQAKILGMLPNNTRGSDNQPTPNDGNNPPPSGDPNTPPTENSGEPNNNANGRRGVRFGAFNEFMRRSQNLNNVDTTLDPYFNNSNTRLNNDFESERNAESEAQRALQESERRLRELRSLPGLPSPTPIPLPEYKTGNVGFPYVNFRYDNHEFKLSWDPNTTQNKRVDVRYYPPATPSQIKTFALPWDNKWDNNVPAMLQDVLQYYELDKSAR